MLQITNNILMIRPVCFRLNEQTASNNYYQQDLDSLSSEQIQKETLLEFNNFVNRLRSIGVNAIVFDDTNNYDTPDSLFPNNWVTFHSDGLVVLYPMFAKNRRKERREDILNSLVDDYGFKINKIKDFTELEEREIFLEGTGSMVLDRFNRICYAAISLRTDEMAVIQFCEEFGYRRVCFTANQDVNNNRVPIYHTNVMMCVADRFAVICLDSIDDIDERTHVVNILAETNKEVIEITEKQKHKFAGNMLQVMGDRSYLVMSTSAFNSLTKKQKKQIKRYCPILHSSLNTIESCGGGSARCMIAEVFLPKK